MWKIEPSKTALSDVVLESAGQLAEQVELYTNQGAKLVGHIVRFSETEIVIWGVRKNGSHCLTSVSREEIVSISVDDGDGKITENLREID